MRSTGTEVSARVGCEVVDGYPLSAIGATSLVDARLSDSVESTRLDRVIRAPLNAAIHVEPEPTYAGRPVVQYVDPVNPRDCYWPRADFASVVDGIARDAEFIEEVSNPSTPGGASAQVRIGHRAASSLRMGPEEEQQAEMASDAPLTQDSWQSPYSSPR